MSPIETRELLAFVTIVDTGSISSAARDLGVPRATVTRQLARLEERLSTRLLRRTTRRMNLTAAGEALYGHARGILDAVGVATRAVARHDDRPRGLLRVSVPPLEGAFRGLFSSFAKAYPEVQLEVIVSMRYEDLLARNIDVAWRAGTDLDPGLIARRLLRTDMIVVASPAYLERHGVPRAVDALRSHTCLVGFRRGERPATHWPLLGGGGVRVTGRLVCNDMGLLRDAAVDGLGLALIPRELCGEELTRGALVPVLEAVVGAPSQVALVYLDREHKKPALTAFIAHAVALARRVEHAQDVAAV